MKAMSDFFGSSDGEKPLIDLGKCQWCGNHELHWTDEGTPFMRSRRDCCVPQLLHRANILLGIIQEGKEPEAEIIACNNDLKTLTSDLQGMLANVKDRVQALQEARERMAHIKYQADVLPRLIRSVR